MDIEISGLFYEQIVSQLYQPAQFVRLQFFPELNEPARPTAARPVSCDTGGPAPGERGADRATGRSGGNPAGSTATRDLPGLDHGGPGPS